MTQSNKTNLNDLGCCWQTATLVSVMGCRQQTLMSRALVSLGVVQSLFWIDLLPVYCSSPLSTCLTSFPSFPVFTLSSFFVLVVFVFLLCQQDTKSSPLLPPDLLKTLADFEEEEELVFSKPPDFFQVSASPLSSAPGPNMFVCTQTVITCSSPV